MSKQTINPNYPNDLINVGTAVNAKNGDVLRTAFTKINDAIDRIDANFAELYSTDTSTKYHLGDDVQFVDVDPVSGAITIQSGYNTGMPVYIKGANCASGGVGGNVVIEAGAPPLANGGPLFDGTVGNVEIAAQQTSIDSNGSVWTFKDDGSLETPNGQTILSDSVNIGLQAQNGVGLVAGQVGWEFDALGRISVPSLFPRTFTAVLDTAHMTDPNPSVALVGESWQMDVTFAIVDGQIETHVQQIFPIVGNSGYVSGYQFGFTEADHGIPGYSFSIGLQDVILPGGAGWTANILASPAPEYPSTITSEQSIKLTANTNSWILGSDGNLILPDGGVIKNFDGTEYGGGGGGTIWTNPANGCLRVELSSTGFQAFTDGSHVDLQDSGVWNIGSYQTNTTISNDGFANTSDLWLRAGDAVFITTDLDYGPGNQWMFSGGSLSLPGDINFKYGGAIFEGGHDLPGRGWRTGLNIVGSQTTSTDPVRIYPYGTDGKGLGMGTVIVESDRVVIQANNQGFGNPGTNWTFAHDGTLTFPQGGGFGLGDSGQVKINDGTTLSLDFRDQSGRGFYTNGSGYTLRSNGTYSWIFDEGGILNLPNSTTGSPLIQATNEIQFNADGSTFTFGADGNLYVPNEIRSSAGVGPVTIQANDGTLRTWTFGGTGTLQLPPGGDIVDSAGETVLGFAASYLSGYNVVSSDPSGIKVTGDVSSVFSSGQIIKFSTLTEDEYTVDVVAYDSGNDWTTISLVEGLLGPVNGDAIYFEKYNVSEIYPGEGIYATLMNNVLTLGTTGTYYPSTPSDWNNDAPTTITEALDRLAGVVKALNGGTGA